MSFFTLSTGEIASGDADKAFNDFGPIPHNTMALASLEGCMLNDYNGEKTYKITWALLNDPFKNRIVRQNLKVFDLNPEKADKAKQMFMLLFNICKVNVLDKQRGPSEAELHQLKGKVCGIKIIEWKLDSGTEGNSASEIHPSIGFKEEAGTKRVHKPSSKPSYDYNEVNPPFMDDDISF